MHESPGDRRSLIITSAVNLCTADDVSYVTGRRRCHLLRGVPCNYLIVCPGVLYAVSATMETNKMPGLSPSWVPTLCSGQLLFCLPQPGANFLSLATPPPAPFHFFVYFITSILIAETISLTSPSILFLSLIQFKVCESLY